MSTGNPRSSQFTGTLNAFATDTRAGDFYRGEQGGYHWKDQIVLRIAGKAAEEVFNCPADPTALFHDMLEVDSLLNRMGMSLEREGRIEEGKAPA